MVLEARKDAETIGYNIVGEDAKEASNVIDYQINPEQTKDTFAKINANNDTTTGMANVIPGINAPKLLAETSIIGGGAGGGLLFSNAEYGISVNPGTVITKYDLEDLTSGGDLYSEGGDIHCDSGTYLITLNATVSNSNVTSTRYDLRIYDDNGYVGHIAQWGGANYVGGSVVQTFTTGNYIQLRVELNYGTANSTIKVNFVKLA